MMALPHFTIHKLTSAVADFPGPPKKKKLALVLHGSTTKLSMSLNPEKNREGKVVLTSLMTVSAYSHIY